jgi:hypothetical protein
MYSRDEEVHAEANVVEEEEQELEALINHNERKTS